SSKSAARRQPRRPAGVPPPRSGRVPAGAVAGEIREKGPTRVQSRRRQTAVPDPLHRTRLPPTARERTPRGPARRAANAPPASGGGERRATGRLLPSRGTCPAPLRTPAVHLGDLLRIWVRPGARFTPSPPDFQGPARAHRTPPEPRRFPGRGPLSRGEPIPGNPALHKEKRTLPGAPASFSGIVCVAALDASRRLSPPLQIRGSEPDSLSIGRGRRRPSPQHFRTAFAHLLGPTDPCSTAVHMEPFSTSAFKVLV
uniref:Uncharacterized protein n=1 Tax=Scophthalmus maximus TaxID=52904 RepID=A0A8D3CXQ3_SCOMX